MIEMLEFPTAAARTEAQEALLGEIEELANKRDALKLEAEALQVQIKEKAIYCRLALGKNKLGIVGAAGISRPTLDAWLDDAI